MKLKRVYIICSLIMAFGCVRHKSAVETGDDILVTVGDSSLTTGMVLSRLPAGLSPEDSVEFVEETINRWVRYMVLSGVARENLEEADEIERMVEDYRNRLIISRYLARMDGSRNSSPDEKEIKEYYSVHGEEFILQAPLIKGVFVKVTDTDERLGDLKRWMSTATDETVDNIEKYGLRQAMQYEYFDDRWIEWGRIAELIPYRFYDADAFVKSTRDFETSYRGITYLLHISDYLPSGEKMPYEYASEKIRDILSRRNSSDYRSWLLREIYKKKIRDGVLKPFGYDPVAGKMKNKKQ